MSVEDIIAKIVNLALGCGRDSVWTNEANNELHTLAAALRIAYISEAGVGKIIIETFSVRNPLNPDWSHIEHSIRWNWFNDKRFPDIVKEDLLLIPVPKKMVAG